MAAESGEGPQEMMEGESRPRPLRGRDGSPLGHCRSAGQLRAARSGACGPSAAGQPAGVHPDGVHPESGCPGGRERGPG